MNFKNLFTPSKNMTVDEAKIFIKKHKTSSLQLVDVRQPREYEREHIPGAILIPLRELLDRKDELDPDKTILVYCSSGVRSKAGCQLLKGQGFTSIFNISGGLKTWRGDRTGGEETGGMEFFVGGDYRDVFKMAYAMEDGLKQLYLGLRDMVAGEPEKELLQKMADFEDRHKLGLVHGFLPEGDDIPEVEDTSIIEGGRSRQQVMDYFGPHLHDMEDILHLSMLMEVQAYDLYSRLAHQAIDPDQQRLFSHLAQEEKIHLAYLGQKLDQLLDQV
ncbi:MAG: rhodanese-like domain-containing protein [Desulfobulbaceae bacterium]|jgi:rhodanese-related sulfurtransferase|nr:rhodanese-like domain-containing protein [Desulfobulbaceae bacterium]